MDFRCFIVIPAGLFITATAIDGTGFTWSFPGNFPSQNGRNNCLLEHEIVDNLLTA